MTCSIVYDAIQIKTTRFEKPAPLINCNEVAAAIRICYQEAKLTPPPIAVGVTVGELRNTLFEALKNAGETAVNPQLLTALREYPNENETIDAMAKEVYEFQL